MIQEKDLKIGMKVKIPKTKKYYGRPEDSTAIRTAKENEQDFLYFIGKDEEEGYYILNENDTNSGDFFALEDIELYEEPFILPTKWGVRITEENREVLKEWAMSKKDFNVTFDTFNLANFVVSEWWDNSYQCYNNSITNLNKQGYTEITFTQFKQYVLKEETMKLPTENFGIKVTNENAFEIVQWFKDKKYNTKNYEGNSSNDYIYWTKGDKNIDCTSSVASDIKIYTLEEIKQIENQTKNNMETKELLGYKLIKSEYEEAACKIVGTRDLKLLASGISIGARSHAKIKLEEAGVLHLWFEKVYKKEEEFKIGDWVSFYSETNKKLHTAKIRKLGSSYHYLSDGTEPFVHLLRKATEEEITAATEKYINLSQGKAVFVTIDKIIAEGKIIQYKHINNLYCNTNTFGDTNWKIQYNTFDIGCWKNVTRADLRLILDAYEEINGKLE